MTALTALKSLLHITDSSFDVVPDGYTTTPEDVTARGKITDIAAHVSSLMEPVFIGPRLSDTDPEGSVVRPFGAVEVVGQWVNEIADLSDLPTFLLTIVSDLSPEVVADVTPRPAGRHFAQS